MGLSSGHGQNHPGAHGWVVAEVMHTTRISCSALAFSSPTFPFAGAFAAPVPTAARKGTERGLGTGHAEGSVLAVSPDPSPWAPKSPSAPRGGDPQLLLLRPSTGSCSEHPGALHLDFRWCLVQTMLFPPCPTGAFLPAGSGPLLSPGSGVGSIGSLREAEPRTGGCWGGLGDAGGSWERPVRGQERVSCQLFPTEPLEGGNDPRQSRRRGAGQLQLGELGELGQPGPGGRGPGGKGLRRVPSGRLRTRVPPGPSPRGTHPAGAAATRVGGRLTPPAGTSSVCGSAGRASPQAPSSPIRLSGCENSKLVCH